MRQRHGNSLIAFASQQAAGKLNAICYNLNLSGAYLSPCQYGDISTSVSGVMASCIAAVNGLPPSATYSCPVVQLPLSEVISSW